MEVMAGDSVVPNSVREICIAALESVHEKLQNRRSRVESLGCCA